jgi:hypothetical protein
MATNGHGIGPDHVTPIGSDSANTYFEERYFGSDADTIATPAAELNDYWNGGGGDDTFTDAGAAAGYTTYEDLWGADTIGMAGGNDLVISRDGGDVITIGNTGNGVGVVDAAMGVSTVRIYPTHDKDHVYGQKDDTVNG